MVFYNEQTLLNCDKIENIPMEEYQACSIVKERSSQQEESDSEYEDDEEEPDQDPQQEEDAEQGEDESETQTEEKKEEVKSPEEETKEEAKSQKEEWNGKWDDKFYAVLFAPTSKKTNLKILKFIRVEKLDKNKNTEQKWQLDDQANQIIQEIKGNQIEVGELFRNAYWNDNDNIYFFTDQRFLVLGKENLDMISQFRYK